MLGVGTACVSSQPPASWGTNCVSPWSNLFIYSVWCDVPPATANLIAVLMDLLCSLGPLRYIFIRANGLHL